MPKYYLEADGTLWRITLGVCEWWSSGWILDRTIPCDYFQENCIPVHPEYAEIIMEKGYPE